MIIPGRKYTHADFQREIAGMDADALVRQGYVLRQDLDGTIALVHWTEASSGAEPGTFRPQRVYTDNDGWVKAELEAGLKPIVKRTPLERVDSLMLKLIEDCKASGTVPALTEEKISEIVGAAWVAGRSEVTAEVVRSVAAHFLQGAERQAV